MGSPAWAGIDRRVGAIFAPGIGFPRVGGDRPPPIDGVLVVRLVPPRGRG